MNITIYNTQDGKTVELRDIPNAPPMVSVNGVVQQPGTYRIVGQSVFFDHPQGTKWQPWFAWRPVKVNGVWSWGKMIYRKPILKTYVTMDDWNSYEYGTILDVLKET